MGVGSTAAPRDALQYRTGRFPYDPRDLPRPSSRISGACLRRRSNQDADLEWPLVSKRLDAKHRAAIQQRPPCSEESTASRGDRPKQMSQEDTADSGIFKAKNRCRLSSSSTIKHLKYSVGTQKCPPGKPKSVDFPPSVLKREKRIVDFHPRFYYIYICLSKLTGARKVSSRVPEMSNNPKISATPL